jgi:high-affinity nickel-transport protein
MIDYMSFSGIILMLALGLRHGLDPDHIAAIDGMTYRAIEQKSRLSRWVGTLFALGHGMVVTIIAFAVSILGKKMQLPEQALTYAEWIPVFLLFVIGTLNLKALLVKNEYHAVGWKHRLLPRRLRRASHPAAIVLIGVFFAVVFDTATQAAAWGYAATATGGTLHALMIGVVFTFGMVLTDSIDGRIICSICEKGKSKEVIQRYRRMIGWFIVFMSYGVAGYKILSHFNPALGISDVAYSVMGLSMMLILPTIYFVSNRLMPGANRA